MFGIESTTDTSATTSHHHHQQQLGVVAAIRNTVAFCANEFGSVLNRNKKRLG